MSNAPPAGFLSAFEEVLAIRGHGRPSPSDYLVTGADPVLPTQFPLGETTAAVLAGVGVALSDIWQLRSGRRQRSAIDVRHAAASLRSAYQIEHIDKEGTRHSAVDDASLAMLQLTKPWPTRDGRWFVPHVGLPHLRNRLAEALICDLTPASVARAIALRDGIELEERVSAANGCGAMVRSNKEWLTHAQGSRLAHKSLVEITKIAESPPEPLPFAERPLSGIRVLDLTRILAGPMAARTLAEHGADVLMVTTERLPQIAEHVLDTSHGKRSCFLDIKRPEEANMLCSLIMGTDIFSQGYRPGALERQGFGPRELAALRPGIIYLSIDCYGDEGPWARRGGWEQLAQAVTGLCHEHGGEAPALLPGAACDYITGYLGAYGALLALRRRAVEGGSYHVHVSLCKTAMFLHRQPRTRAEAFHGLSDAEVDELRIETMTHAGILRHFGPILRMSETPGGWDLPTPRLGSSAAAW